MGNKNAWVELYLGEIAASACMWSGGNISGAEFIETVEKILEKLIAKDKSIIVEEEVR